jgi:hypothetical protein
MVVANNRIKVIDLTLQCILLSITGTEISDDVNLSVDVENLTAVLGAMLKLPEQALFTFPLAGKYSSNMRSNAWVATH